MLITIAGRDTTTERIEGPTAAQARKMAAYRLDLLASAGEALAVGDDDRAFELDCQAFDVEADLVRYGFTLEGTVAR